MWIFFVGATNDFGPVVIYEVFTAVFLAFLFCVFMVVLLWRNNIHVNMQASIFACSMGPTPSTFQANEVKVFSGPAFTLDHSTNPRSRTLTFSYCCHTDSVALARRLMVSTTVIHVNTWTTTHLPTHGGWKAELA